mmetsp:Transcript_10074/g.26919  ORF Transcript_10074/g.26919 Transcript_10074/m.26919 type:complete len:81 (+) Transcript_10074:535-777(+)
MTSREFSSSSLSRTTATQTMRQIRAAGILRLLCYDRVHELCTTPLQSSQMKLIASAMCRANANELDARFAAQTHTALLLL